MLRGLSAVERPDRWTNQPVIRNSGVPQARGDAAKSPIRQRANCRIVQMPPTIITII